MSQQTRCPSRNAKISNILILVLGALANVSLLGVIGISLMSDHPSGES